MIEWRVGTKKYPEFPQLQPTDYNTRKKKNIEKPPIGARRPRISSKHLCNAKDTMTKDEDGIKTPDIQPALEKL